jgi:Ser/Thr protein kinase RdoA (MazF antagonist)
VGWDAPLETRRAIYRTWGQLQVASSAQLDRLRAAGCLDRRLDVLASQIDRLVADERALSLFEEAERVALRRAAPRLKALCGELARYRIPYALLHGDLHPANVAAHGGRFLFFDLTDGSIAHPFFDLMYLFHADAEHAAALLESYMEAWSGVAPVKHLQQAWSVAAPLCALHHTISYQHIIANLEPQARHELAGAMTFFGRKVLELLQS